ncbi:hypothetical protein H2198_001161 [Neophaeococcomyces mojaviensis]|uniref:Uncharacterized protein n=1 Tax=Neophaeococcomyces mojaviensis TaxID=3383035 RepID=A0ACC3AI16_9EURO|nr:hypothetical protein H2198_001161 [Knufia sp. JES_112]
MGKDEFANSTWFTSGWTLQELVVPVRVLFYNSHWKRLGCRETLSSEIASITRIDPRVLQGKLRHSDCSVAQRMAWASRRETTQTEDRAYSLLGLFSVNMSIVYGVGEVAFRRLQQEIVQRSDDQTIFAWSDNQPFKSILAPSPSCFEAFGHFDRILPTNNMSSRFQFVNLGLSIELMLLPLAMNIYLAPLWCGRHRSGSGKSRESSAGYLHFCLFLQRIEHGTKYLRVRVGGRDFAFIEEGNIARIRDMLQCKQQQLIIRQTISTPPEAMFYGFKMSFHDNRIFSSGSTPRPEDVLCIHKWEPEDPIFQIYNGSLQIAGIFRLSGISRNLYMYLGFDPSFSPLCVVTSQTPSLPHCQLNEMNNLDQMNEKEARQILDLPWLLSQINSPNQRGTIINFRGDHQGGETIICKTLSLQIRFEFRKSRSLGAMVWCVDFSQLHSSSGSPAHFDTTSTEKYQSWNNRRRDESLSSVSSGYQSDRIIDHPAQTSHLQEQSRYVQGGGLLAPPNSRAEFYQGPRVEQFRGGGYNG